jgi:hypothetical protein
MKLLWGDSLPTHLPRFNSVCHDPYCIDQHCSVVALPVEAARRCGFDPHLAAAPAGKVQ